MAGSRVDWVATGGVYGNEILHVILTKEKDIVVVNFTVRFRMLWGFGLGAADVLFHHLEMAKSRLLLLCAVLADVFGGETVPASKITPVNSFNPSRNGEGKTFVVEVVDERGD